MPEIKLNSKINFKQCQSLQEVLERIAVHKEDLDYNTWIKAIEFSHQISLEALIKNLETIKNRQKEHLERKKFWDKRRGFINEFLTYFKVRATTSNQYLMQNVDFEKVAFILFSIFEDLKFLKYPYCQELKFCLLDKLFITLMNDADFSNLDQVKQILDCFNKYQSFSKKGPPALEVFFKKMSLTNLYEKKSLLKLVLNSINMPQNSLNKFIKNLDGMNDVQTEENNMQIDEASTNDLPSHRKVEEDNKKEPSSSLTWHDFFARECNDSNPRLSPAH